jgi:hypothetical protein
LRYAILFSGISVRRHVNGLELCYRTLVDRLGFASENIRVLNYDGSLRAYGDCDPIFTWPGDRSPFRMVVSGPGSRSAFQQALSDVGAKLTPTDDLFINTLGHGGHHGGTRGPDLFVHPHSERYRRDEFCADLGSLPPHRSLTVLMAQCFSGGFIQGVLDASPADATYIATATDERHQSFADFAQPDWDSFQRNWVCAVGAHISFEDAFERATHPDIANPCDRPQSAARPPWAATLNLSATGCQSSISSLL